MDLRFIEAGQGDGTPTEGLSNWGKFLIGRFTNEEWAHPSQYPGHDQRTSLIRECGWTRGNIWVLDLQTGEGAMFHPVGFARADLARRKIHVCVMFEPFLTWLYAHIKAHTELGLGDWFDTLPGYVQLPDAAFELHGYRRRGPLIEGFTCPRCEKTSYHPDDVRNGYCGHCHQFTGGMNLDGVAEMTSSAYNFCFPGGQHRGAMFLPLLGFKHFNEIGRFRDAWPERRPDGTVVIHMYTRLGGLNRGLFAEIINDLRDHPLYIEDADDAFDTTYASFWFYAPPTEEEKLRKIAVEPIDTGARWRERVDIIEKMRA